MRVFRFALLVVGLCALVAGIALVVTPRPAAPRLLEAPPGHDVYLGTETCYVCHPSVRRAHEPALIGESHSASAVHAALVSSPDSAGPHTAGTEAASLDGALAGSATLSALTDESDSGQTSRYVLQTERGYAVLPDQWGRMGAPGEWLSNLGDCAACHVVNQKTGQRLLTGRDFTCEMCHGPGGVHVEALVSPRVNEQLRRLSAPLVDLALCQTCHAWAIREE